MEFRECLLNNRDPKWTIISDTSKPCACLVTLVKGQLIVDRDGDRNSECVELHCINTICWCFFVQKEALYPFWIFCHRCQRCHPPAVGNRSLFNVIWLNSLTAKQRRRIEYVTCSHPLNVPSALVFRRLTVPFVDSTIWPVYSVIDLELLVYVVLWTILYTVEIGRTLFISFMWESAAVMTGTDLGEFRWYRCSLGQGRFGRQSFDGCQDQCGWSK